MANSYPAEISVAIEKGLKYFYFEDGYQWKFAITKTDMYPEALDPLECLIFANNGFGDFLFIKRSNSRWTEHISVYRHENNSCYDNDLSLAITLNQQKQSPSKDGYPIAKYPSGEEVKVGDKVKVSMWFWFFKKDYTGIVDYVPGISHKRSEYEYNGLKWINVVIERGNVSLIVDYKTGIVTKAQFISR